MGCVSIAESPLSIECRVREIVHLGSHDMFIAEVLNVLAAEELIDAQTGAFRLDKAGLMAYSHGGYFKLGEKLGTFGWSVKNRINIKSTLIYADRFENF